jgi:hypothetical protein
VSISIAISSIFISCGSVFYGESRHSKFIVYPILLKNQYPQIDFIIKMLLDLGFGCIALSQVGNIVS